MTGTTFEGFRFPKGSFSIRKTLTYKPSSHQRFLRKDPCQKNDKIGTKERKFSVHCVQDGQKDESKEESETFQEIAALSAVGNGLEGSAEEHLFSRTLIITDRILIFADENISTVDPVLNKENDWVVTS